MVGTGTVTMNRTGGPAGRGDCRMPNLAMYEICHQAGVKPSNGGLDGGGQRTSYMLSSNWLRLTLVDCIWWLLLNSHHGYRLALFLSEISSRAPTLNRLMAH
jgi:hypothetical protein